MATAISTAAQASSACCFWFDPHQPATRRRRPPTRRMAAGRCCAVAGDEAEPRRAWTLEDGSPLDINLGLLGPSGHPHPPEPPWLSFVFLRAGSWNLLYLYRRFPLPDFSEFWLIHVISDPSVSFSASPADQESMGPLASPLVDSTADKETVCPCLEEVASVAVQMPGVSKRSPTFTVQTSTFAVMTRVFILPAINSTSVCKDVGSSGVIRLRLNQN
ncbi:unnamed protein product [Urochloa humidicola]